MKDNWKEEYLEKLNADLNVRIEELENENSRLERENEYLKKKDKISQETIKSVREVEFEYYKALEELKGLKDKYKKVINDAREMKNDYSEKFREAVNDVKAIKKK